MLRGAVTDKEGGRKITSGERFTYFVATITGLIALASFCQGELAVALTAETISSLSTKVDVALACGKAYIERLQEINPRVAGFMAIEAEYALEKREESADAILAVGKHALALINNKPVDKQLQYEPSQT